MTVVAPCRLHFGLFHVPVDGLTHWPAGTPVRKFGGLGLMVRTPAVRVSGTMTGEFAPAVGTLRGRATEVARLVSDKITLPYSNGSYLHVRADGPPEHVGLGVGTALSLAVARTARSLLHELGDTTEPDARLLGRGQRSGIGLYGFRHGGFIVDDGKVADELPRVRERIEFPVAWRIVLVRPPVAAAWHGPAERSAFHRRRPAADALATTARLLRTANEYVIPALKAADFDTFAASLTEFNRAAGEPFRADQGGPYAGPAVSEMIKELLSWNVRGVGQSSWGPTVFAMTPSEEEAERLAARVRARFPNVADVTFTAADNEGARVLSR